MPDFWKNPSSIRSLQLKETQSKVAQQAKAYLLLSIRRQARHPRVCSRYQLWKKRSNKSLGNLALYRRNFSFLAGSLTQHQRAKLENTQRSDISSGLGDHPHKPIQKHNKFYRIVHINQESS